MNIFWNKYKNYIRLSAISLLCIQLAYADVVPPTPFPSPTPTPLPACVATAGEIVPNLLYAECAENTEISSLTFLPLEGVVIEPENSEPVRLVFQFSWGAYEECPPEYHNSCTLVTWKIIFPDGQIEQINRFGSGSESYLDFTFDQDGIYRLCVEHSGWQNCNPAGPTGPFIIDCQSFEIDFPGDHPPNANNLVVNNAKNIPVNITYDAKDDDGSIVTYAHLTLPKHGTLSNIDFGLSTLTYTPGADYEGTDFFIYRVFDNDGLVSNLAAVRVNTADPTAQLRPVAESIEINMQKNTSVAIQLLASDVNGTIASYTQLRLPAHGTLSNINNTAGTLTYTPDANFTGTDNFFYRADDNDSLHSNLAGVHITVWDGAQPTPTPTTLPYPSGTININTEEYIPDPNLRKAMEAFMGVAPGGTITERKAAFHKAINADFTLIDEENPVTDLTGLEYFKKLRTVQFHPSMKIYTNNTK